MNINNNINRKVGIIGGVGPQSTEYIYNKVIQLAQSKYGAKNNDDFPHVIIESVPIPDFISSKDQIKVAKDMLIKVVHSLEAAGATKLCIGSNTVHILLDELSQETEIPFISMPALVANMCSKRKLRKVGVLGTPVLIHSGLYTRELQKLGIETVLPTKKQIQIAEKIIRGVISGFTKDSYKQEYIDALNNMFEDGAEAIILGCTELPLALNYEALGSRTINSDEVLAEGIVNYYYKNDHEK